MAKLTGPLMSLDASGSVAGALTFAKWKGRNYVRQLVTPANPKTAGQTANRAMLRFLGAQWAALNAPAKATWAAMADTGKYSPFNAFCAYNLNRWTQYASPSQRDPADEDPFTLDAAITVTGVGGVRQATLTITPVADVGELWGGIVFRGAADPTETPAKTAAVGVLALIDGSPSVFVDTPLEPGTWHYRVAAFDSTGTIDWTTISADDAIVVT